jgi:hypothetical protein
MRATLVQVFGVVGRTLDVQLTGLTIDNVKADGEGYVNQYGLSRKVLVPSELPPSKCQPPFLAHLRGRKTQP